MTSQCSCLRVWSQDLVVDDITMVPRFNPDLVPDCSHLRSDCQNMKTLFLLIIFLFIFLINSSKYHCF
ncbi:hypothetical protein XENTR_v10010017 [Xenopus tropicalis]|nr:hypothetical protein XENTR_v10010017 [Xenopus tropicalis]